MKQRGPFSLGSMALLVIEQVTEAQVIQESSSCILSPEHLLGGNAEEKKTGKRDLAFKHNYNGVL